METTLIFKKGRRLEPSQEYGKRLEFPPDIGVSTSSVQWQDGIKLRISRVESQERIELPLLTHDRK